MGCHFLLQCMKVKSESEVTQSCPTLSDPMDCSLPGSSIHGIFQARVLEWGAIARMLFGKIYCLIGINIIITLILYFLISLHFLIFILRDMKNTKNLQRRYDKNSGTFQNWKALIIHRFSFLYKKYPEHKIQDLFVPFSLPNRY